jgi:hypothetical protein
VKKELYKHSALVFSSAVVMLVLVVSACVTVQAPSSTPSTTPTQGTQGNRPPAIASFTSTKTEVFQGGTVEFQAIADDPDNDKVNYAWSSTGGTFTGGGAIVIWQSPKQPGSYEITIKAEDGKGGTAQKTMSIKVVSNQNPVISRITADPAVIAPGGSALITCEASDPDGDTIRYSWSANEGNITGTGNRITWFPPAKGGTFNIVVLVKDEKGGEATSSTAVTVATSTKTATFNYVKEESGTGASDGDRDRTLFKAGDNEKNTGFRAFWSFNIFSLNRTEIKSARLIFTTKNISGNPFAKLGSEALDGLRLWKVTYTDQLPPFGVTGQQLQKVSAVLWEQPSTIDVTPDVEYAVKSAQERFQIEALFMKTTNGNGVAEWIEWSDLKLEVTYTEIP